VATRTSASLELALSMPLDQHHGLSNASCYFQKSNKTSFGLHKRPNCTTQQCKQDVVKFSKCPFVHEYHRMPDIREEQTLTVVLRRLLRGHRLAIFGDSMSRQVFSVLIALLRGETSFLDHQIWNPARYQMFWPAGAETPASDNLDLFYRPLRCDWTFPKCNNHVQRTAWNERNSSLKALKAWLTSKTCAHAMIGKIGCSKLTLAEEERGTQPDIEVVWFPHPTWLSVKDSLRLAAASEFTAGRPFTMILNLVPSAWHLEGLVESGVMWSDFFQVPSYYWDTWSSWQHQSAEHRRARYASLTMPTDLLSCDTIESSAESDRSLIKHLKLNQGELRQRCGPRPCCRLALTVERNRFQGLPPSWQRVDFDAIVRGARHEVPHLPKNWHYECILLKDRVSICAHRPMVRMGLVESCIRVDREMFATRMKVGWTARENGDCGEAGNTLLWAHLARDHARWFGSLRGTGGGADGSG
jgi:hypothetical protein